MILRAALLALAACCAAAADAPRLRALVEGDGSLHLLVGDRELGAFNPGFADPSWRFAGAVAATGGKADDTQRRAFSVALRDGPKLSGAAEFVARDGIAAAWVFTPEQDAKLNSVHVSGDFPVGSLIGGGWRADGKSGSFPATLGDPSLFAAPVRELAVTGADGLAFTLHFTEPTPVMLQDNRRWNTPTFAIRIGPGAATYPAGKPVRIAFALAAAAGIDLAFDHPVTIAAGSEWIPLAQDSLDIEAGSALDFSGIVQRVAPAGKLGRLIATSDGHFAFADDAKTARRFYGVNLCFSANYLTHEDTDRLADRLVRLGYNALRIHHYERDLLGGKNGGLDFDAQRLDQLDYLLAACGKRGIYVTTDLFVSRPVPPEQLGLPKGTQVNYKALVPVVPAAFDDWKAFARKLLGHANPHSGRRWADDATLAWLAMINEDCVEGYWHDVLAIPEWKSAWNAWLVATYHDRAALAAAWPGELKDDEDPARGTVALPPDMWTTAAAARARDAALFIAHTESAMVARMRAFLRDELHCQALITDGSIWTVHAASQLARQDFDYVDDHFYVDHPSFIEQPWRLPSRTSGDLPLRRGDPCGANCAFTALAGKPMVITEFNWAAPARWRAIGGPLTGALAALQDWDGVWRFAYAHSREAATAPHGLGYFDVASDPLNQAAERAALCLFLRGDAKAAGHRIVETMSPRALTSARPSPPLAPPWTWAAWITAVRTQVHEADQGQEPLDFSALPAFGEHGAHASSDAEILAHLQWLGAVGSTASAPSPIRDDLESDTHELSIIRSKDRFLIDAPRTAGGYAGGDDAIVAEHAGLRVDRLTTPATVFACALDDQPLRGSRRILVSHLTELLDDGMGFAEESRRTLTAWGKLPHLVHAGSARVALTLAKPEAYRVWALSTSGKRIAPIATQVVDGALVFTADVAGAEGARMLYEVAAESP